MSERLTTGLDDAGILTLRLNRPEKCNAMDTAMVEALLAALQAADLDAAVNVVLLRGAGKDFCAGADLAELLASADRSQEENAANAGLLGSVFVRMRELPKPVLAVVEGRALAGGCGLATACDMILAHEGATFGYPEVQRGFVPAMVMAMLRRAVGERIAFDLVATGRLLTAAEAARVGLVARVIEAGDFEAAVNEVAGRLASSSSTALALIKKQLYELDGRSFADGIRLGTEVNALARSTPDFKQSVAQFLKQ
ncbi:MAG: enoyl-CoA hydratase/isomerase family protein [Gemmatimonadetes bacterium]|nr:enoyl-CoA hydratase/isomerase family protein [Gemmatimonadota bacterium]